MWIQWDLSRVRYRPDKEFVEHLYFPLYDKRFVVESVKGKDKEVHYRSISLKKERNPETVSPMVEGLRNNTG